MGDFMQNAFETLHGIPFDTCMYTPVLHSLTVKNSSRGIKDMDTELQRVLLANLLHTES
jgi:hypothetical protein